MAAGDFKSVMISADGDTAALATTAYNTAVATLMAGGGTIWQKTTWKGNISGQPSTITGGMVFNQKSDGTITGATAWGIFTYISAA